MQALRSYWTTSRAPRYSVTFALPLLLLYEGLAATLSRFAGEQMRYGADVMMRSLFITVAGSRGPMLFVLCVIAILSVAVWAHHMFVTGAVDLPFFSGMTFLIAVPTGVKFFNWIGTMW